MILAVKPSNSILVEDNKTTAGTATVSRRHPLRPLWLVVALALLVGGVIISIRIGSRPVAWSDVVAVMGGSVEGFEQAAIAKRIPRTLLAILIGSGLAVSGALMQGVTRNPVADPGLLGVNMGASLAIVIGIAFFGIESALTYMWVAILGSAAAAAFVYLIASLGHGGASPLKLALAGAATSIALSSFVSAILLPRADIGESARSWQIGGIGGATWSSLSLFIPMWLTGVVLALVMVKALNILALGDELAASLGERILVARGVSALAAVILAGAATAVAGPIAFVGLMAPHAARLLIGPDYRWILPTSAVIGAALLLVADVIGRVVAPPTEIAVGILTALVGAPIFIILVREMRVREL